MVIAMAARGIASHSHNSNHRCACRYWERIEIGEPARNGSSSFSSCVAGPPTMDSPASSVSSLSSFGSSCLSSSTTNHSRASFSSDWGPEVAWNGYDRDPAADGNSWTDSAHSSPLAHAIAELVQQDHAPHSPIPHLPIELLSEIFEFACLSEHNIRKSVWWLFAQMLHEKRDLRS